MKKHNDPHLPARNDDTQSDSAPGPGSASRRRALRGIVAGGGAGAVAAFVPGTWTRPVVDSVLLPAHAQTSVTPYQSVGSVGDISGLEPSESQFRQFVDNVTDMLMPSAHAASGWSPYGSCLQIEVDNLLDPDSDARVTLTSFSNGTGVGNGSLQQLESAGIITDSHHTVTASGLTPGGGGTADVDGIPVALGAGRCRPTDGGEDL